jgi:hypothetical protein
MKCFATTNDRAILDLQDLYPTQIAPSGFGTGQRGRFNLLEHRARQVAKRLVAAEVAAEVGSRNRKGAVPQQPPPATGKLKFRDPRSGTIQRSPSISIDKVWTLPQVVAVNINYQ